MVGMRDVAKKAKVSLSTVSLVVNHTGYVSKKMRTKVEAAMKALDYVPNELARNFHNDSTHMIGMIVPTIRHPFFARLTASVQHELAERGYQVLLCSAVDADTGEAEYVDMLRRHIMDGIIMAAHTVHDLDYWSSIERPVVAFDRYLGPGVPAVFSDHEEGGAQIAKILLKTKARHVVMIGGPQTQFHDLARYRQSDESGSDKKTKNSTAFRLDSGDADTTFPTIRYYLRLEEELGKHNVRFDYVEAGDVADMQSSLQAARSVFDRFDDVDAIVGSDLEAAECVQEAIRRGIDVPHDLQIIAYDGTYLANVAGMRMTAVCQNFDGIANLLVKRLLDSIALDASVEDEDSKKTKQSEKRSAAASTLRKTVQDATTADKLRMYPHDVGDVVPITLRVAETTR
ncbi:LacI family DNA-binding transcriptional regulator [Bifidobacterium sp. ESL0745]|uniref:LacI family DNA-binding transcriptional regulator n=1 Tax=Bifidobacterium sp. ESL0745 TaxID=2983226 RepID=UPI0023F8A8C1|nr:LacI family DNA-binding transcriptional regulator [Bifidobacterium sp. ESL0745]MDF7665247.1 LacI family DNA-binding transcriptional regulator [Bifidobacterium sp. ESL0745]